jgi:hypothetical protein
MQCERPQGRNGKRSNRRMEPAQGGSMRCIPFNPRFVNEAGTDLVEGKVHTIQKSYSFWKRFEGQDVALFTWEGKPYRSKQRVFCVKKLVSVQRTVKAKGHFFVPRDPCDLVYADIEKLAKNDGFENEQEFADWFRNYLDSEMVVLHFTDFRY